MRKILLLALLLASGSAFAQLTAGSLPYSGATKPATCTVGAIYFQTSGTIGLYECAATNTWTLLSAATNQKTIPIVLGVCQGACSTGSVTGVSATGSVLTTTGPTPYGIAGSSTTPQWGTWQFTTAGALGTGNAVYYGPFTLPSNYVANSNIVLNLAFADPTVTSGTVTWEATYADKTPTSGGVTAFPTFFGTPYSSGAVTTAGTVNNSVPATITFTPNTASSPATAPGDQLWFVLFLDAVSNSNKPYLTQMYLSY